MLSHVGLSRSRTLKIVCIPKGVGGDRKAPGTGSEQSFVSHKTGVKTRELSTLSGSEALLIAACAMLWCATGRKGARSLRSLAVSCECGWAAFPALQFGVSSLLLMSDFTFMPFCFFVQRRVVASRRVGRCPTPCKGRCPLTPQASACRNDRLRDWLDRALFNALRVRVYSFISPADIFPVSCTRFGSAELGAGARPCTLPVFPVSQQKRRHLRASVVCCRYQPRTTSTSCTLPSSNTGRILPLIFTPSTTTLFTPLLMWSGFLKVML